MTSPEWNYTLSPHAMRDMRRLDRPMRQRIFDALDRLAVDPFSGRHDLDKVERSDDEWRLRVGDWRIRFLFERDSRTIIVTRVLHRREAFRE